MDQPGAHAQSSQPAPDPIQQTLVVQPSPVDLQAAGGLHRKPTRPPEHQDAKFEQQFDHSTIFFDCFFADSGTQVILPAPPFLNLQSFIERMDVVALPSGRRCQFFLKTMDRHSQVWVTIPAQTTELAIRSGLGQLVLSPGANQSDIFEDRRVLLTLSKNNRLEWIQDWMRYNRDVHGANAILIYDNQSTRYSVEELLDAVGTVSGFDRICVVAWPFKYGPQGLDAARFWDSDFCQIGALAHARWRFLQRARSALNSDIDELVVSRDGSSIFEAAERSRSGVVRFHGVWIPGLSGKTPIGSERQPIRYDAFEHYRKPPPKRRYRIMPIFQGDCPPKWAVVPGRCPTDAQWTAHTINGWRGARGTNSSFCYRHFKEISDNWKYDRSKREIFVPGCHIRDELLMSNFRRVDWTH
jgi:hypothetical protein